jgi:hypothetical protein
MKLNGAGALNEELDDGVTCIITIAWLPKARRGFATQKSQLRQDENARHHQ